MSWSYRITILYLGFVGIIVTLVTISNANKEELVSKDYYAKELRFQDRINAQNNEKALIHSISHEVRNNEIVFSVPEELRSGFSGEIFFFCPSASSNDLKLEMKPDEGGKQNISKKLLKKGVYKMQLSWTSAAKEYYKEEVVNIN